MKNYTRSCTAT